MTETQSLLPLVTNTYCALATKELGPAPPTAGMPSIFSPTKKPVLILWTTAGFSAQGHRPNGKRLRGVWVAEGRHLQDICFVPFSHFPGTKSRGREVGARVFQVFSVHPFQRAVLKHAHIGDIGRFFVGRERHAKGVTPHGDAVCYAPCAGVDEEQSRKLLWSQTNNVWPLRLRAKSPK